MQPANLPLKEQVYELMSHLPVDKVTTYGDVAAMAGYPRAARIVGGICHYGPIDLPWHRLVNAKGGLARGFPGGPGVQQQLLEGEGFVVNNFIVMDFEKKRWRPLE